MKNDMKVWLRSAGALVAAGTMVFGMVGCNGCNSNTPAPITNTANGSDPADANLATADGSQPTQVMGQSAAYTPQQSGENYAPRQSYSSGQQAPAPIVNGNGSRNEAYDYNTQDTQANGYYDNSQSSYQQGYANGQADEYAQVDQAPPELPVYEQPPAPDPNDIWTPGYWGYANTGYYWNPGVWVSAPFIGALWTPSYWGYDSGRYRFHHGFWGRHIGYYGGINYGYGYIGTGYYGGYWNRDHFYYNNAVTRVSPRIMNVYERNVVVNNIRYTSITNNRISYNGGRGGVDYQPRPYELAAMREQHVGPLPAQQQFHREAAMNRANFYADNHGRPTQLALAQPVRTERIAAPAEVNRGGFGRGFNGGPGAPNGVVQNGGAFNGVRGGNVPERQLEQQRNAQIGQQPGREQRVDTQQHGMMQPPQQRIGAEPGRGGVQQQERGQAITANNNALAQQRAAQLQRNQAEPQRGGFGAQRNQQPQQERMQGVQGNRAEPQQQQRAIPEQRLQQQQRMEQPRIQQQQAQPRAEQPRFQPQQQQRIEQPRAQFNTQPHVEGRPMQTAPQQQRMEAPRAAAPAPRAEAPRAAAPAAAPHMEAPHGPPAGGGGHGEGRH